MPKGRNNGRKLRKQSVSGRIAQKDSTSCKIAQCGAPALEHLTRLAAGIVEMQALQ
jgi:hypothetical protein